jgi:hypothetical protein
MFRKLAAAAIAVSLIAGPALAQGTTIVPATTSQTAGVKTDVKVKTTEMKVTKTKKHVAMHRHHRKHFAHVKHVKHVKIAKHLKHIKQVKQPAKNKIAG